MDDKFVNLSDARVAHVPMDNQGPNDSHAALAGKPPVEMEPIDIPEPALGRTISGKIVPKEQAPDLTRNERRRMAKLHRRARRVGLL